MDQHNGEMPKTSLYREEYCLEFVRRWDELIDWEKRYESENGFFRQILRENKVKNILDIACGTGFHTLTLSKAGFNVTGADGSANMLAVGCQRNWTLLRPRKPKRLGVVEAPSEG